MDFSRKTTKFKVFIPPENPGPLICFFDFYLDGWLNYPQLRRKGTASA
jgi:hypothetical protein